MVFASTGPGSSANTLKSGRRPLSVCARRETCHVTSRLDRQSALCSPFPCSWSVCGDFPFLGDWDCDGIETPGLYRQSDGFVYLRNSNSQGIADIRFLFGNPGDIPIAGDFDGDGCDTVSIYRPSEAWIYVINELGAKRRRIGCRRAQLPIRGSRRQALCR